VVNSLDFINDLFVDLIKYLVTKLLEGWSQLVTGIVSNTILYPFTLNQVHHGMWEWSRDLSLGFITVVLVYGALKGMVAPATGIDSTDLKMLLPRLVVAGIFITMSYKIVEMLLALNNALILAIVDRVSQAEVNNLFLVNFFTSNIESMAIGVALLILLLALVLIVVILYVLLTYFVRQAEIVFLTILSPVMASFWVLRDSSGAWGAVMAELIAAVFIQAGQAVVLWLFLEMGFIQGETDTAGQAFNNLFTSFACMLLMLKVPSLLRTFIHNRAAGGYSMMKEMSLVLFASRVLRGRGGKVVG
jgi:hypothetical protein